MQSDKGDVQVECTVPELEGPRKQEMRRVFAGLMIVLGLGAIDESIVATALPKIINDLGNVSHLPWIVTSYVFTSTITIPLYGKLVDEYHRRTLIQVAVLAFLFGSILCGTAQSLPQLVLFRAIQGVGAGGFLPLSQVIISDYVTPVQRGKYQGGFVAVVAIGSIAGPILGGIITDLFSWRWVFYVNLPISGIALITISTAMRERRKPRKGKVDFLGALLMTCCTTSFLLAVLLGGSEWRWFSVEIGSLSVAFGVLLGLLVSHVRRAPEPILPLALFNNHIFLIACAVMALTFMALFGSTLLLPLFFQTIVGVNTSQSGLLLSPLMAGVVIASILNGRILLRSGRYKPTQIAGLLVAFFALLLEAWAVSTAKGLVTLEIALFLFGIGIGLVMPNMTIAVQSGVPPAHRGAGTSALTFMRSLGGMVGVAGAGAIFRDSVSEVQTMQIPLELIYRHVLTIILVVASLAIATALAILLRLPEIPLGGRIASAYPQPRPVRVESG